MVAAWVLAWGTTLLVHGGGAGLAASQVVEIRSFAEQVRGAAQARWNATIDVTTDEEEEPAPPPPVEEPPEEEELPPSPPEPKMTPSAIAPEAPEQPSAPPPEAAEAGRVLTSEPDPDEPLDLTDQGFITGTGTRFAGGVTASQGTAKEAVRDRNARSGGSLGTQGSVAGGKIAAPAVDLSKPAKPPPGSIWKCPFPPEADAEQIHRAKVVLVVVVNAAGRPKSVSVVSDPGFGFGRAARRCAMQRKFLAGVDKFGKPAETATRPFTVTFDR